jgi:hypothetical protein
MQIIKETPTELCIKVKPIFSQIILSSIGILVLLPFAVVLPYSMSKNILKLDAFASVILIGLSIMLIGIILLILDFIFRITYLNVNKCESKISSRSISLFGLREYFFDLQEIKKIEVVVLAGTFDTFVPTIFMQSGKIFELSWGYDYVTSVIKANKVRKFLDLPTEEILG